MPTERRLRLPHNWKWRGYQRPLWKYLQDGGKRAVAVWHRRSGKDDVCLHAAACQMVQKPGTYWHLLPEASQGRKAIWEAINPHTGRRRIDEAFPKEHRLGTREQEMLIRFPAAGGVSTWQVVGSDNYDSLVGSPPLGVVFSEYALAKPSAWGYIRPILLENDGWAVFVSTPRGRNHLHALYQSAEESEDWFTQRLTVNETGLFTADQLERERREMISEYGQGIGEAIFQQEYFCSWDAAIPGAIYAEEINRAEQEGRITSVPYDPAAGVETWWDLGIGDSTSIVFAQDVGRELHVIDYYESSGKGIDHYAKVLHEKPYTYSRHLWPHDGEARELGTGRTLQETARAHGLNPVIVPRQNPQDGINAGRQLLRRTWIDKKLIDFIEAMRQYRYEWDEKRHDLKPKPLHDWTSHCADAWRTGAMRPAVTKIDPDEWKLSPDSTSGYSDTGWMGV